MGLMRIALGFTFLWAFFDKLFGLGYATTPAKSWLNRVSPTTGFLKAGATGKLFGHYFNSLAGSGVVDWLFMLGLLYIGFALTTGITLRLASLAGMAMVTLMWLALVPSANNPIVDDHVIYFTIFLVIFNTTEHGFLSLYNWWTARPLVQRNAVLR